MPIRSEILPVPKGSVAAAISRNRAIFTASESRFIPGITTHYDQLTFAGHHSQAALLGVFDVSVLHNLVHLLFGVAGIALARTFTTARAYLIGGGVIYLVLFVYGLVIDRSSAMNFVPVNSADNWLHLGLGLGMLVLGAALGRTVATHAAPSTATQESPGIID